MTVDLHTHRSGAQTRPSTLSRSPGCGAACTVR